MINGLDIFYVKTNTGSGLKIVDNKGDGLNLVKGRGCKNNSKNKSQRGSGLKILE